MKLLDLTLPSPAENLAADEALLDAAETSDQGEVLRFWESATHFVVVGYSNRVADEVNVKACEAYKIPILRRCSGGGTVLQGPGCLNYTLILRIASDNTLQNISLANQFIMGRNRTALQTLLKKPVRIQGYTDLTRGELKFSGNSQRRHRMFLLFHGTFLLNFDLTLMALLLRFPSKQPDYRESREHEKFLTQLEVSAAEVKAALTNIWQVSEPLSAFPQSSIEALSREKYSTREWSFKF